MCFVELGGYIVVWGKIFLVEVVIGEQLFMDIVELLVFFVKNKVFDLYLFVGLLLMIWVDGDVCWINILVLDYKQVYVLVYDIMFDKQCCDYEEFFEVDFFFEILLLVCFCVNVFNQNRGVGVVFCIILFEVFIFEDLVCLLLFCEVIQ